MRILILVTAVYLGACGNTAANETRPPSEDDVASEGSTAADADLPENQSPGDVRPEQDTSPESESSVVSNAATTQFSPPPPAPPVFDDDVSYPNCVGDWREENLLREKVASLRDCKRMLENFRIDEIEAYGGRLQQYELSLLLYEAARRREGNPQYDEILIYFHEELVKLDPELGTYREPYRRFLRRYRGDMQAVERQICSLRHISRHRGC